MKFFASTWVTLSTLSSVLALATGLNACAVLPAIGADSWKEEVLLHDGQKIIVDRTTQRGGRHEVGQKGNYIAQSLRFTLPGASQTIEWQDNRGEDLGNSSFLPMVLDIAKGTPYLVASPMGCLSYNKWGRPNPPYVVFKYDANTWQRIPLQELPLDIKTPNLVQSSPDLVAEKQEQRFVTAQKIAEIVEKTRQPEYRSILREPLSKERILSMCEVKFTNGMGTWLGADWFSGEKDLTACERVCDYKNFKGASCPCGQFFQRN